MSVPSTSADESFGPNGDTDVTQKKRMTRAERKKYARIQKKILEEKQDSLTKESYAFEKVEKKVINGKTQFEISWAKTIEDPCSLFGCESYLKKNIPEYKNKNVGEIAKILIKEQEKIDHKNYGEED